MIRWHIRDTYSRSEDENVRGADNPPTLARSRRLRVLGMTPH